MHSSERNKEQAHNNILTKISTLELLNEQVKLGSDLHSTYLPKTIRQFNQWKSEPNSSNSKSTTFSKNANDTLRKYPLLRQRTETLLTEIRDGINRSKKKAINPLPQKLNDAKKYISILEQQLALQQILILENLTKNTQEQLRLNNIIAELRKNKTNER